MNDFFAAIYEGFHPLDLFYIEGFSDNMLDSGIYPTIGLIMLCSSFLLMLSYYKFISDYNSLYKKGYWFIWVLVIGIINFITAYYYSEIAMDNFYSPDVNPYVTEHINFSMVNLLWAVIFSFLFSLALKFSSDRATKTPF